MMSKEIIEQAKEKLRLVLPRLYGTSESFGWIQETLTLLEGLMSEPAKTEPITGITPGEMPEHWKAEPDQSSMMWAEGSYGRIFDKAKAEPAPQIDTKEWRIDCLRQALLEACSRLDAQAKEITELKVALEEISAFNNEMTAENAKLSEIAAKRKNCLEITTQYNRELEIRNKALAERNEKLKEENGLLRTAIAKQAEPYSVSLPKEIMPPGPVPEDPLVLAARQLLMCFPEEIPTGQKSLKFNIPAYIVKELRQALKSSEKEQDNES